MTTTELVALTPDETERLEHLVEVVDRGVRTFFEVGEALMEIRDRRLYRTTHPTFASFCLDRWGFSDSRGRQLIAAARFVTDVTAAGLPAPRTEGEARRLARELRDRERPLEQHPLVVGLAPDFEPDAWDGFVDSIRRYGLINPIVLFEGMILDGWARYRACLQVGVEPKFTIYEGDEPARLFARAHLMRKHYTEAELSKVMAEVSA